jgi:hypothetical protein
LWYFQVSREPRMANGHAYSNGVATAQSPEKVAPTAADILDTAAGLVSGDRDRSHGAKHRNFANIAALWSAYLAIRKDPGAPLTALDVGHLMALMKVARTQSGAFNADDYVDGAGYLGCAGEIAAARATGA